jgi:hypothetical protein
MKEVFWIENAQAGQMNVIPRREYDLIEFIKLVRKTKKIEAIEIDEENHIISFLTKKSEG